MNRLDRVGVAFGVSDRDGSVLGVESERTGLRPSSFRRTVAVACLWGLMSWEAESGPEGGTGPAESKSLAGAQRIPKGKGSTTPAGKFVATRGEEDVPGAAEQAEAQLRGALNVMELAPGKFRIGQVTFDATARTVSLPATVNIRGGVIEYVLTTEKGKVHESLFATKARPRDMHLACLLLGMKSAPLRGDQDRAMTLEAQEQVRIWVSWETNGPPVKCPLAACLRLARDGPNGPVTPIADGPWHYTGSVHFASGAFAADSEGSFISLIRDRFALMNYPGPTRDNDSVHLSNSAALPRIGYPVTLTLQLPAISKSPGP